MKELTKASFGFQTLENLANNNTIIHQLNPLTKTVTTFLYVVIVVSFNRYSVSALIPFVFYPILLMALSETPFKPLLARLVIALPFCLFGGLANIIYDKDTSFFIGGIAISFGLVSFLSIMIKCILTVMAVLILIATTTMPALSRQLIRLKVPTLFVLLLSMTYRYISVLIEESVNMYTAYLLRSGEKKGIRMKDMGIFLGQLILRSMDRAERIYFAMKCRGFSGDFAYIPTKKVPAKEWMYIIILTLLLFAFRFANPATLIGNCAMRLLT